MDTLQGYLQHSTDALPFLERNDLKVQVTHTDPSNAYTSVKDTVGCMAQIIRESSRSPIVLSVARQLYMDSHGGFIVPKLQSIFSYIRSHVKFVEDESVVSYGNSGRELLIRPEVLLTMINPQGDCDDFTMLAGSLMLAMGIVPKITTVAASRDNPGNFTHVFLRVYYVCDTDREVKKIDFDCSHGLYMGWKAQEYFRIQEWEVI